MPKFKFKDLAHKAAKPSRSQSLDENNPLISSTQSLNNQMYTQGGNRRTVSESSSRSSSSSLRVSNPPQYTQRSSRSPTNSISETPMVKIRAGSTPSQSSPPPSPTPDVDIDFNLVPFKFYTRVTEHWKSGLCQALVVLLVCLLCPSVLVLFVALCSTSYSKSERKKKGSRETRKLYTLYVVIGLLTLIKDLIVIALVLQLYFKTDASTYIVVYSPIVYCWFLMLFMFPIALFYLSDVQYELSSDKRKKKLTQALSKMFSKAPKRPQNPKLSEEDRYFEEKYGLLSTLQSVDSEIQFVWKATSRHLIYVAIALAFAVCVLHILVRVFFQLSIINIESVNNTTSNNTTSNLTSSGNATQQSNVSTDAVIGLSTVNSFVASILASLYFCYVVLWNFGMLKQWKNFNTNENDSATTLVNGGPEGIAMWWKIRQTLRFFSNSRSCLSVLLGKMLCAVCMVLSAVLSITIILKTYSLDSDCKTNDLAPMLLDNLSLYLVLLILGTLTLFINKELRLSSSLILSKQLNVSYELSRLMNLEKEKERGVKTRVNAMRGCLTLLQEMNSTMAHLENNTSSARILFCLVVGTIIVLVSTVMGSRYLHYYYETQVSS